MLSGNGTKAEIAILMPRDMANHISWTFRNVFVLASILAYKLFSYQVEDHWSVALHDNGREFCASYGS